MRLLSLFVLIAWGSSLLRTIINLLVTPRLTTRSPRAFPRVSVIVPARDEERAIEQAVRALLAQTYPQLEVIVVNDRSSDATGDILESFDDPRLLVLQGEEPPAGWLGKPWALHQGSLRATGEWLLFVDADIVYAPGTIEAAVACSEEHEASLLSLLPKIVMRGFWEHVTMPNLAVFLFCFWPLWFANKARIAHLAVGGGPGNMVRRKDYDAAGGHAALRDAVVDDVGLARLMRRSGFHTVAVRAETFVQVRMYHGLAEVVGGFTKNMFAVLGRSYVVALLSILAGFLFHILPYILAILGDPVSWATVGVITLSRLILFLTLGYRIDNALFGHPLMLAVWIWITLRSMWLTGVRKRLHWRGRVYDARGTRGAD